MQSGREDPHRGRFELVSNLWLDSAMIDNQLRSGIHHMEEIRAAGYEMPAVNQIEVRHSTR